MHSGHGTPDWLGNVFDMLQQGDRPWHAPPMGRMSHPPQPGAASYGVAYEAKRKEWLRTHRDVHAPPQPRNSGVVDWNRKPRFAANRVDLGGSQMNLPRTHSTPSLRPGGESEAAGPSAPASAPERVNGGYALRSTLAQRLADAYPNEDQSGLALPVRPYAASNGPPPPPGTAARLAAAYGISRVGIQRSATDSGTVWSPATGRKLDGRRRDRPSSPAAAPAALQPPSPQTPGGGRALRESDAGAIETLPLNIEREAVAGLRELDGYEVSELTKAARKKALRAEAMRRGGGAGGGGDVGGLLRSLSAPHPLSALPASPHAGRAAAKPVSPSPPSPARSRPPWDSTPKLADNKHVRPLSAASLARIAGTSALKAAGASAVRAR